MIIHWEGKHRGGGAIVEEILDISKDFDVADRILIITTNPVHEDVVHFAELGIARVIRPRLREKDLTHAVADLMAHIQQIQGKHRLYQKDDVWQKLTAAIDNAPENPPLAFIEKVNQTITRLKNPALPQSLREVEAVVGLAIKTGNFKEAEDILLKTLDANPNYFRGWNRLIEIKRLHGDHPAAYALLQKMQLQNRGSVRRLVAMGEVQIAMNDHIKAESFFRNALDKDGWCAPALNGLAEVTFAKGSLDETKQLLSKSSLAYKFAVKLNDQGIAMARQGRFKDALEHYSKAQYVLPQQEKSPRLFYNIGLCYAKWGKPDMAKEFFELALIKEPRYKKAQRALENLGQSQIQTADTDLDAA
jgi:tetratricopeptide (TPR) repeat protein